MDELIKQHNEIGDWFSRVEEQRPYQSDSTEPEPSKSASPISASSSRPSVNQSSRPSTHEPLRLNEPLRIYAEGFPSDSTVREEIFFFFGGYNNVKNIFMYPGCNDGKPFGGDCMVELRTIDAFEDSVKRHNMPFKGNQIKVYYVERQGDRIIYDPNIFDHAVRMYKMHGPSGYPNRREQPFQPPLQKFDRGGHPRRGGYPPNRSFPEHYQGNRDNFHGNRDRYPQQNRGQHHQQGFPRPNYNHNQYDHGNQNQHHGPTNRQEQPYQFPRYQSPAPQKTTPVTSEPTPQDSVGPKPNIFGLAKPIDTHAKMQEIEKKLHEEKKQDIPLKPIDIHPTSRPPFNQSQSNEKYNDQGAHTDHQRQKFDSSHGVNSPLQPQQSQIKVLLKRGDKSRQEFAPMSDKGNDAASVTSSVNSQRSSRNTRSRVKEQIDAHILSNAEQPKPLMQEEKGPPNKFPINPTQPHSPNVSDQRPKFGPDPNTNRTPNKEFGPRKPFHPPNDSKGSQFPSQFPPYQGGNNNSRPPPRSNQYHNSHQDSNNKHTTRVWTRRTSQASDQTAGSLSNEKPTRNFTPKQPPNAIDGTTTTSLPDDKNAVASRPPFNKTRQRYAKNRRNKNEVGTGPNITEGQPKNGDDRAANVDLVKEKTAIDEPNPATENKKVSSEPIPTDRTTKESCKNVEKSIEKPDTADSSERSLIDETQRQSSTDTSAGQGNNNGGKKEKKAKQNKKKEEKTKNSDAETTKNKFGMLSDQTL